MGGNPPASKRDKFLLEVEILSSKRDLHELLDHQAEDLGNIVYTVMAAAYKYADTVLMSAPKLS